MTNRKRLRRDWRERKMEVADRKGKIERRERGKKGKADHGRKIRLDGQD